MYNKPMKFYLAGAYHRHPEMEQFAKELRAIGDDVTCEWITGVHSTDLHANSTKEDFAIIDLKDLFDADGLIQFGDDFEADEICERLVPAQLASGGRNVEFGVALCLRILNNAGYDLPAYRLVVVDHRQNIFHYLSKYVEFYPSLKEFLTQRQSELSSA